MGTESYKPRTGLFYGLGRNSNMQLCGSAYKLERGCFAVIPSHDWNQQVGERAEHIEVTEVSNLPNEIE